MDNGRLPAGVMIDGIHEPCPGLTKREHFACLALASLTCNDFTGANWARDMADNAVCIADALLAELGKDNGNG